MQHVFSVGGNSITFRASPFVSYNHPQMEQPPPPEPRDPTPPPPQQKLLIKLRVSDLGKVNKVGGTSDEDEVEEAPAVKRRGGGPGSRGKRRKVDSTPTSDDGMSVAWDSSAPSAAPTPAKRGRGKGSRGGGTGRGRGGRKSGLQHQVLPVPLPGTPDSVGELSLRPASPSSESTPTITPISTPTIPIPTPSLPLVPTPLQPSTPSEIDPALLATAPRRPLPTRAFPVQAAPKAGAAPQANGAGGVDWNRRRVRRWGVKMREVRGVGGGSWWVRTWVGSPESEYASDPTRILSVPNTLPRPSTSTSTPKPRKTDSSRSVPKIKPETAGHYRDRDQEGVELLTAFASSGGASGAGGGGVGGGAGGIGAGGGAGGIGANHYRDREYYRTGTGTGGESSGGSTPAPSLAPVPKVVVKYDLARDGIEEVVPPPSLPLPTVVSAVPDVSGPSVDVVEGKGKGKEVVLVNGSGSSKGKEKAVEEEPSVDGRLRSGSGYAQAAKDVEMELMGET